MPNRHENSSQYRYSFNTQEKVDEISGEGNHTTALYWEYDTRLGRRWNVDPVTYPWQSSYATFDNSPIWKTDFLGLFGSRKEARKHRKDNNLKGRIRINDDGYYSINDKKAYSTTYKDQLNGQILTEAMISGSRPDSKTITPFEIGTEWLTGVGAKSRDFTSGDLTVELYRKHQHYKNAQEDLRNKLNSSSSLYDYNFPYKLDGLEGVGKYIRDYSTLATGGQTGNLMFTYLGSHSLWIEVTAIDIEKRVATVTYTVHNMSTLESATRLPYFGYKSWYQSTVGEFMNTKVAGRTGPTSETEQVFQWTETINY